MPIISQFYGIVIYMYREIGANHKESHVHIKYNEYEVTMDLKGKILSGKLPRRQQKLVAAWNAYQNDGEIIKIKGLE